jgi:hypothetical protein
MAASMAQNTRRLPPAAVWVLGLILAARESRPVGCKIDFNPRTFGSFLLIDCWMNPLLLDYRFTSITVGSRFSSPCLFQTVHLEFS